jgi:hypothetical protein
MEISATLPSVTTEFNKIYLRLSLHIVQGRSLCVTPSQHAHAPSLLLQVTTFSSFTPFQFIILERSQYQGCTASAELERLPRLHRIAIPPFWLRHYATSREVTGSSADEVIGFFK